MPFGVGLSGSHHLKNSRESEADAHVHAKNGRLEGQGLPSRGHYAAGSLYIRLIPDNGAPESPAREQLKKFAAAWAA